MQTEINDQMRESVLRDSLRKAEGELASFERQRAGVQARIDRLQRVVEGLRYALGEVNPAVLVESASEWPMLTRHEAVARVLDEVETPLTYREIQAVLQDRGRDEKNPNGVSAALSRLKDEGRAVQVARGRWTIPGRRPGGLPAPRLVNGDPAEPREGDRALSG